MNALPPDATATSDSARNLRYALVGGVNTLVGLTLFPVLQTLLGPLGVHYMVTLCLTQLICITLSFAMMRRFVFRAAKTTFGQYLLHSTFYWAYFAFNLAALPILIRSTHRDPRVLQFFVSLLAVVLALFWQTRVVYRTRDDGR